MPRPIEEIRLIGRNAEFDRIVAGLKQKRASSFVIAGAAGVGKSRLAAEAAEHAGLPIRRVTATESGATIPFAPFARFLPATDAPPTDLLSLLRFVGDAVCASSVEHERPLLVVDDAHLLDLGSATLVHQLLVAGSCSVIATVRTPNAVPDPITALWKDGLAVRIDLDPLNEPDVERFVAAALGGAVAGATVRRLYQASAGNPLWLRELLTGAQAGGALVDDSGMWTLRRPLIAPDRLAEIVGLRLDTLAAGTVLVVELLAAAEPLSLDLLECCTEPGAVEDAERHRLVRVVDEPSRTNVGLAHPIYGEVVRRRLPRARLRTLWARLADAMEVASQNGAEPTGEDLLRLVTWQLDAGRHGDPSQLSRAARRASQMSDKALAARLARAAFDAGGGVEAGLALGVAEFSSGNHDYAEEVLAALVPLCADDDETARVAGARAYNLDTLLGRPDDAEQVIAEALAIVTDAGARSRLLGRLAIMRTLQGRPAGGLDAARALLASDDDVIVTQGAYAAAIASAMLGRHQEAIALSQVGLTAHLRTAEEHSQLPEIALIGGVLGHAGMGDAGLSLQLADRGYQACLSADDKEGQATFSLLRGSALVAQGHLAQAARAFREGASINRELNDVGAQRWCLGGIALAEAMAGRAAAATAAVSDLDALPPGWIGIFELDLIERGRAWAWAATGETTRARHGLERAAARAENDEQRAAEVVLRHDLVRLGAHPSADRLGELSAHVDGALSDVFAQHASARTGNELDHVSLRFESLGALLLAAETAAAAVPVHRADGFGRAATAAARRSERFLSECGDILPPGLRRESPSEKLTAREDEIAGLAARGASSRQIADRLVVSVRTVDNHLHSVYTKLGVTNRDELAAALHLA